jgi:hypothetical protein
MIEWHARSCGLPASIVFEVKIRMQERLMVATFPTRTPSIAAGVPHLVPGQHVLRQRNSASS